MAKQMNEQELLESYKIYQQTMPQKQMQWICMKK